MVSPPTGTITFLFTDIEGSSRLWENRPEEMRQAVAHHDGVITRAIEKHDGYVFATTGDGFGGAFSDPLGAALAAIDAQRDIAERQPGQYGLAARMGMNTGVAHERAGNYYGPVVNRAARIADAGHGGQVLVGSVTTGLLRGRLPEGAALQSLGEHRLKDLTAPESIHQLVHESLRSDFAPLRTLDGHLNNLPTELNSFVGRREELAEIAERLSASRLVTLTGVGGAGKTRLAHHSAAEAFRGFPDGVWIVELAPVPERDGVAARVVETLGLQHRSSRDADAGRETAEATVVQFLRDRRALMILDNCEHVIDSVATLAERLLLACPDLRILATSREGLGVRGEQIIRVPSLTVPSVDDRDGSDGSKLPDSMELFAERAAAVSHFRLDATTTPVVAEICRRLDGIPLAIELAAARAQVLGVEQILARLTDVFRLLAGGARTAVPRQQTLEATIDWSYQLLDDRERRVFERLAVFTDGFTMEAAEAVVTGDGIPEVEIFDIVTSLAEKSMLQTRSDRGRFVLLETLRQFGMARLRESGQPDRWRERHANHFAAVADEAHLGTRSSSQIVWFDRLDADHENFKAAIAWALDRGHIETAARIADGLWWFWGEKGYADIGLAHIRQLLERDDTPTRMRAGLLTGAAFLEFEAGDIGASLPAGEEAVALARELGDPAALALALIYWANTAAANFGMRDAAHAGYREGYEIADALGDDWLMGWHALNDGWIHRSEDETEEAERKSLAALHHLRRAGVAVGLGWALSALGSVRMQSGDLEAAAQFFEEAREQHASYGNPSAECWALFSVARILSHLGRHESALEAAEAAIALLGTITKNFSWGEVLAGVHRRGGDLPAAIGVLDEYLYSLRDSKNEDLFLGGLVTELGLVAAAAGRADLAAPALAMGTISTARFRQPAPAERAEWDAAWEEIRRHVDDVERIRKEWSVYQPVNERALAEKTLRELRPLLEIGLRQRPDHQS